MRNLTLQQAESLYNRIETKKAELVAKCLSSVAFVAEHFPHHEFAARREVSWLSTVQNRLLEDFAAS